MNDDQKEEKKSDVSVVAPDALKGTLLPSDSPGLPSASKTEIALAIASGITSSASAIPGVGFVAGPIGVLLTQFQTAKAEKRYEAWGTALTEALSKRTDKLEQLNDQLQDSVWRLILEARISSEGEKLERLKNAIVNTLAVDENEATKFALQQCLLAVGTDEVKVLRAFYELPASARDERNGLFPIGALGKATGLTEDLLTMIVRRLATLGLIANATRQDSVFGGTEFDHLARTRMGEKFISFISA